MKKNFAVYALGWAVLLGLFNLIVFISPGWANLEKYTASFWIGYASVTIAYLVQLFCAWTVFRKDAAKRTFYNLSLVTLSYVGLAATFIVALICMVITPLPYWVAAIGCSVVSLISIIVLLTAKVAVDAVDSVDEKVQNATAFILVMRDKSETLLRAAKTEETKALCKKICDAFRYSDPMSNKDLAAEEDEIKWHFENLRSAISENKTEEISAEYNKLMNAISDRNSKCKRLKA